MPGRVALRTCGGSVSLTWGEYAEAVEHALCGYRHRLRETTEMYDADGRIHTNPMSRRRVLCMTT
jgi:hypothetical protein